MLSSGGRRCFCVSCCVTRCRVSPGAGASVLTGTTASSCWAWALMWLEGDEKSPEHYLPAGLYVVGGDNTAKRMAASQFYRALLAAQLNHFFGGILEPPGPP